MSIFEPQLDFILSSIVSVILLGKSVFFDGRNSKNLKATIVISILMSMPIISYFISALAVAKLYLSVQFGLFGIVLGLVFNDLIIKIKPSALESKDNDPYRADINKRKINVSKKLPFLFGIIAFTLERNSNNPHLSILFIVLALCATLLYSSIKGEFNKKLTILSGFTITLLVQFLLSYNEVTLSVPIRIVHAFLWTLSVYLIYLFELMNEEK
jgi:hypothetical protein